MRTSPLLAFGLLVPVIALAVDIAPATFYTDVRPGSSEAAGINLLTRVGAVEGVGDHRFVPTRPVNRAEFLKMAMLSLPLDQRISLIPDHCFPDVRSTDWFSPYVCAAKTVGIVSGQADPGLSSDQWLFDPGSTVQYDAALKILTKLYKYDIPTMLSADWGEPYYQAAASRGTDIPVTINFATPLTRGKAARLIGGFVAEANGQLSEYRLAEAGHYGQESASASVSSSPSSSSSSSSATQVPPAKPLYTLPSQNHFLLVGKASDAIADFIVPSRLESAQVAFTRVTLTKEARSIDHLELRTASGELVATLNPRTTTDLSEYKQMYESSVTAPGTFVLPADADAHLVLVAVIRTAANNGFAEDLVQVRSVAMTLRTLASNQSIDLAFTGPFPRHQTSLGAITRITAISPVAGTLVSGTGKVLGSFLVSGTGVEDRIPSLTEVTFGLLRTGDVSLSSVALRSPTGSVPCTISSVGTTISCTNLGSQAGSFSLASPLNITLIADILIPARSTGNSVHIFLEQPGSPESLGSVLWTDGSAEYRWVEGSAPLAEGTDLRQN